jgi:tetratricopeptide (TPR) repeat protein
LPDDASVNNNVAWFLSAHWEAKARDGRAAIAFATRACQLTSWKQSRYVDTLAAAYAEAGDFDQAVKWEQYALKITPSQTQQSVIDAMRERLELYKDRKPYRMKPT